MMINEGRRELKLTASSVMSLLAVDPTGAKSGSSYLSKNSTTSCERPIAEGYQSLYGISGPVNQDTSFVFLVKNNPPARSRNGANWDRPVRYSEVEVVPTASFRILFVP